MKLILDRITQNQSGKRIATFECGEDEIDISEDNMPHGFMNTLFVNAIVEAEYKNGKLINPIILTEESENKQAEMKNRLHNLFKKGKK